MGNKVFGKGSQYNAGLGGFDLKNQGSVGVGGIRFLKKGQVK